MPEEITAKSQKGKKEPILATLSFLYRGWYDISAPDKKVKYIFYPGREVYEDQFYQENKRYADKNLSFLTSLIKEKLLFTSKKYNFPNQPSSISDILANLKVYDISTIYKGEEFKEGLTSYRKDGSILYGVESQAYKRIWEMTLLTGNEEMAIIGSKTVLVLPSYYNNDSTGYTKDYGYTFTNGNLICPFLGAFGTMATAHTHPSGSSPSTYTGTGYGDLAISSLSLPFKPNYVLRMNDINKIAFIYAAENTTRKVSDFQYYIVDDIQKTDNRGTITYLFSGQFSLINFTTKHRAYFKIHLNKLYK